MAAPLLCTILLWGAGALPTEAASARGWKEDAAGFAAAQRQRGSRGMLVYFYTDWCPHCRNLEKSIFDAPAFQRYMSSIVAVRINPECGREEQALAQQYGVSGYPTVLAFAPGASAPSRLDRMKHSGGRPALMSPEEFVAQCKAVLGNGAARATRAAAATPAAASSAQALTTAPRAGVAVAAAAALVGREVTLHFTNGSQLSGKLLGADERLVTIRGPEGRAAYRRQDVRAITE